MNDTNEYLASKDALIRLYDGKPGYPSLHDVCDHLLGIMTTYPIVTVAVISPSMHAFSTLAHEVAKANKTFNPLRREVVCDNGSRAIRITPDTLERVYGLEPDFSLIYTSAIPERTIGFVVSRTRGQHAPYNQTIVFYTWGLHYYSLTPMRRGV